MVTVYRSRPREFPVNHQAVTITPAFPWSSHRTHNVYQPSPTVYVPPRLTIRPCPLRAGAAPPAAAGRRSGPAAAAASARDR